MKPPVQQWFAQLARELAAAWAESFLHGEFDRGGSPGYSGDPLGAERGIITKVKVDVAFERAIGVERGPAATAHVVALVGRHSCGIDMSPPRLRIQGFLWARTRLPG
jgi:hypothetical protein